MSAVGSHEPTSLLAYCPSLTHEYVRRRFLMRRPLFLRIVHALRAMMKAGCCRCLGAVILQKVTEALRQLATGMAADAIDDYLHIGESIAIEDLKRFCTSMIEVFGGQYLRSPTGPDEGVSVDRRDKVANPVSFSREHTADFLQFVARHRHIRINQLQNQLRNDLIEHLWHREGELGNWGIKK
ncbi:hypothetical protein PsorP6_007460 [Peronosclerospora sorghi]|uniref:Uncharacterized protein n=1 Tax=Peronosclerospora sorghi TaxID=230839 RepID=A0ACC0W9U9_9STRA|nr:hypothetical protein PsorP6_007460 [Peronosclerospora sorghi]